MKNGNCPKRRDRGRRVPLDVDTASEGVHRNRFLGLHGLPFCVTLGKSSTLIKTAANRRRD